MNDESQRLPEDEQAQTPTPAAAEEAQQPETLPEGPVPSDDAAPPDTEAVAASEVSPGLDVSAESESPPASSTSDRMEGRFFPPTWALLLLLLGVVVVVAVALGVLRQTWLAPQPEGDAGSLSVEKISTFDSPPDIPADLQVLQENGTPLSPALPNRLMLQGAVYPVIPVPLEGGRWPIPARQDDIATWVYGTLVNYVIGLPYTTITESRLASLEPGARITLTLSNGTTLVFGSPQAQRYASTDTTPLSQSQPGLTLVLLGVQEDKTDRLVVQARYLPDVSPAEGTSQNIGGLDVLVLDAGIVDEVENGRDFVVEFEVTPQGADPVQTRLFDLVLEDGEGQRYTTDATVSQKGKYGPLPDQIAPGETVQGSAGYRISEDAEPPLTWIFRADPALAESARFSLPYEPPFPGPPQPQVELTDAFADENMDVIVINGRVQNTGESRLDVTEADITLSSSEGEAELLVATPTFPWQIEAGSDQVIELQFALPIGVDSVLLDILGFTFQIDGLP